MNKKSQHIWNNENKSSPFKVPENYFEELPLKMQERIKIRSSSAENPSFWTIFKPQLSLALSMVFLILAGYFAVNVITDNAVTTEINQSTVAEVLAEQPDMIDEFTLLEAIDEDALNELDFSGEINTAYSEEIIDYLVESNIEIETIAEAL